MLQELNGTHDISSRQLDEGELDAVNGGHAGIAVAMIVVASIYLMRRYLETK